MRKTALAGLSLVLAFTASARADNVSFVACPIVRDNEDAPCWLSEYKGQLYFLGIQQDLQDPFFPPQLKHKALIEGEVSHDSRCGGVVLNNVKVSVLPDLDLTCQTMLPAEGYHMTSLRRGEGPDPATLSAKNQAASRVVPTFDPPFTAKTYAVYFDFDNGYMPSRSTRVVTLAWQYAQAAHAKSVEVIGYRGGALLSDGETLMESDNLGPSRAAAIVNALADLGLPRAILHAENPPLSPPVNGKTDFETRRVEIVVTP